MLLISTLLFAIAIGAGLLAVYQMMVRDRDPVVTRLPDLRARALTARPDTSAPSPSPIASLLALLGGFLPTGESSEALRSGLERAGIRDAGAPVVFLGAKVAGAALIGVGWVTFNWAM